MGLTTEFEGAFTFDKKLDKETYELLLGLSETRRMKRSIEKEYGVDGEFFVGGEGFYQDESRNETIANKNTPPATQPSLWLQWTPTADRKQLVWDGGEKFQKYVEWLEYIINKILIPRGYKLNGSVEYWDEYGDTGLLMIIDNDIVSS